MLLQFSKNRYFKCSEEVARIIAQLTCYKGALPQGAPSSPIISNLICQVLDIHILKLARHFKLDYTRYADDMTFSTNRKDFISQQSAFYEMLETTIRHAGFKINEKKTRLQYKDSRQVVTGLAVNNKLNVLSTYYKKTRAMAHTLYTMGMFYDDGEFGTLNQLEGRFSFIDQLDKYNNMIDSVNKHDLWHLNRHEASYQQFLFYKYFCKSDLPLLVTEGKTDILYLKAALKNLYSEYPKLVSKNIDGTYCYRVRFLHKTKRLRYFFSMSVDGADGMRSIYNLYTGQKGYRNYCAYFQRLGVQSLTPVILIYDNELEATDRPLKHIASVAKFDEGKREQLKMELYTQLVSGSNLYLLTHPLVKGKSSCEIEDLFMDETLAHTINGKTFNRNKNADVNTNYGKDGFSKYIVSDAENIDFTKFRPMLDALTAIISQYSTRINQV